MTARGELLNNPGNIEHEPGTTWVGQTADQPDPKLVKFATPADGLRAIVKTLETYQRKGITTIAGAVTRWAPPSENDTAAYIADECAHCSASPGSPFMRSLLAFMKGLINHEQGRCIYSDAQIQAAIDAAKVPTMTTAAPVSIHPTAKLAGAMGLADAVTQLIVGGFHDFRHFDMSAPNQAALLIIVGVVINHFFPKGDQSQS